MSRSTKFFVILAAFLATGCMTLRDRIAVHYGLPTKAEKDALRLLVRHRVNNPIPETSSSFYLAEVSRPKTAEEVAELPSPVVESPFFLEIPEEEESGAEGEMAGLSPAMVEKETARLRWEALLLTFQAQELKQQIQSLDAKWEKVAKQVDRIESERKTLHGRLAAIEEKFKEAQTRMDEMEAEWSRIASAPASAFGVGAEKLNIPAYNRY